MSRQDEEDEDEDEDAEADESEDECSGGEVPNRWGAERE